MSNEEKPKRRLLIEDADAVVEVTVEGKQHVVKVPDRKAEAEKRGVDESSL
jgi:hypothetical protein